MLTKRQFLSIYNQVVSSIRQIKSSNDKINKTIGLLAQDSIIQQSQQQRQIIQNQLQKSQTLILQLQKNYMDLQTARKTGVVKQQLKIQKDRRFQLIKNINQINQQAKINKLKLLKSQQMFRNQFKTTNTPASIEMQGTPWYPPSSIITNPNSQTTNSNSYQYQPFKMQLKDYDLQMQRQLIQQRHKQINLAHRKMIDIKNIVKQTSDLVMQQGGQLSIVGDQLQNTYKNMQQVNNQLIQANKYSRKSRKKYFFCILVVLAIIGIVVFFVFI